MSEPLCTEAITVQLNQQSCFIISTFYSQVPRSDAADTESICVSDSDQRKKAAEDLEKPEDPAAAARHIISSLKRKSNPTIAALCDIDAAAEEAERLPTDISVLLYAGNTLLHYSGSTYASAHFRSTRTKNDMIVKRFKKEVCI